MSSKRPGVDNGRIELPMNRGQRNQHNGRDFFITVPGQM